MKKIPYSQGINQAFRGMQKAVKKSLKGLNAAAGQRMARGDYEGANELAGMGRDLVAFRSEVEALRKRWLTLNSTRKEVENRERTPLWEFYQPILKALEQVGGEGRVPDIVPLVERFMGPKFKPRDRYKLARGKERWEVMIKRARKHLTSEGWIEKRYGPVWKITEAGKKAAAAPSQIQV